MLNFENLFSYSPVAYQIVGHVLTLGYAVMLAALLYFVLTLRTVAPRYRISSVLSVVVMVSAFLLLYAQRISWAEAFAYNSASGLYEPAGNPFSNGFRYLNWLIDVPMLLIQILFVVELSKKMRDSVRVQFFISGPLMILTGYIGQFYEVTNTTLLLVWGGISTLFFLHVLYLMRKVISEGRQSLPEGASRIMGSIWWLFLISWWLYPIAYLMPVLWSAEGGVVARQVIYTVADISSKVVYGVLLTMAAQIRSTADGYQEEPMAVKLAS
jgi:bacteriorhodopsin